MATPSDILPGEDEIIPGEESEDTSVLTTESESPLGDKISFAQRIRKSLLRLLLITIARMHVLF